MHGGPSVPLVLFPEQREDPEQLDLQPRRRNTVIVKIHRELPTQHLLQDGDETTRQVLIAVRTLLMKTKTSDVTDKTFLFTESEILDDGTTSNQNVFNV